MDGTGVDLEALLGALQLPADTDPQTTVRELVQGGKLGESLVAAAAPFGKKLRDG